MLRVTCMAFLLFAVGCDSEEGGDEKSQTREAPPELCEQYSSYENLKASVDVDELIEDTLEQLDIPMSEDKEKAYLSYRLGEVSEWSDLVKALPTSSDDEFCDVFRSAVRHAHYAYSLENYQLAPAEIRDSVFDVLVDGIGYEFSGGEEDFKDYLSKVINEGDEDVFAYQAVDYTEADETVKDALNFNHLVIVNFAWRNGEAMTLDTFRELRTAEQARVIRRVLWTNLMINNENELNDEQIEVLDLMQNSWPHDQEKVLGSAQVRALPDDHPFGEAIGVMMEVWLEE